MDMGYVAVGTFSSHFALGHARVEGIWARSRLVSVRVLWGGALLTNPAIATLCPVLLAWAAYQNRSSASAWLVRPALAAGIAVLCCVPWTIRNYIQFHKFIPLRSNFAFELYIGNNENYDDQHRFRPGVITQDREILRYLHMGETAFMEEEKRKAIAFIV